MTWSVCLLRIFFRGNWSNLYVLIFQNFTGKFIPRATIFIRQLINAIFTVMINQMRHKFCQRPSPGRGVSRVTNNCSEMRCLINQAKCPIFQSVLCKHTIMVRVEKYTMSMAVLKCMKMAISNCGYNAL